jgi:hypothetical protein
VRVATIKSRLFLPRRLAGAQLAAAAQSFAAQGYETRLATLAAENAALRAQLTPALALAGAAQTNAGLVEECQRMFAVLERTSAVSSSSAVRP